MGIPIVLITGASSGIGQALARIYAKNGFNLLLVGRDEQALALEANACTEKYNIHVKWLGQDLQSQDAAKNIYDFCRTQDYVVDILINNAGLGEHAYFHEMSLSKQHEILAVNIRVLVDLTYLFLGKMRDRKKGHIVNIGSVYSYTAVPEQVLYAASKAFVKSFTLGLAAELKNTGVYASCVCPGSTQTQFQRRAGLSSSGRRFCLSAEAVADKIYFDLSGHKKIIVPGWYNKFFIFLMRILPEFLLPSVVTYMAYRLRHVRLNSK